MSLFVPNEISFGNTCATAQKAKEQKQPVFAMKSQTLADAKCIGNDSKCPQNMAITLKTSLCLAAAGWDLIRTSLPFFLIDTGGNPLDVRHPA